MRKTVVITTLADPSPRRFHLDEAKAERFAARIIAEGGAAEIGPFDPGPDLRAVLRRALPC